MRGIPMEVQLLLLLLLPCHLLQVNAVEKVHSPSAPTTTGRHSHAATERLLLNTSTHSASPLPLHLHAVPYALLACGCAATTRSSGCRQWGHGSAPGRSECWGGGRASITRH